jgi:hypothetical protein
MFEKFGDAEMRVVVGFAWKFLAFETNGRFESA